MNIEKHKVAKSVKTVTQVRSDVDMNQKLPSIWLILE